MSSLVKFYTKCSPLKSNGFWLDSWNLSDPGYLLDRTTINVWCKFQQVLQSILVNSIVQCLMSLTKVSLFIKIQEKGFFTFYQQKLNKCKCSIWDTFVTFYEPRLTFLQFNLVIFLPFQQFSYEGENAARNKEWTWSF